MWNKIRVENGHRAWTGPNFAWKMGITRAWKGFPGRSGDEGEFQDGARGPPPSRSGDECEGELYNFIFVVVTFRREEKKRMATTAIDGISGLRVLEENELLKEVCVVMDAIGFPLSTGFMIRELGFCSVIAMRNASIGYYPSTGYAWMLDEDRKTDISTMNIIVVSFLSVWG